MRTPKHIKATKRTPLEKMIAACVGYTKGEKTLKQVWYAVRGQKNMAYIQRLEDKELGGMLFILALDFNTWYDDKDEIVADTVHRIAKHVENRQFH